MSKFDQYPDSGDEEIRFGGEWGSRLTPVTGAEGAGEEIGAEDKLLPFDLPDRLFYDTKIIKNTPQDPVLRYLEDPNLNHIPKDNEYYKKDLAPIDKIIPQNRSGRGDYFRGTPLNPTEKERYYYKEDEVAISREPRFPFDAGEKIIKPQPSESLKLPTNTLPNVGEEFPHDFDFGAAQTIKPASHYIHLPEGTLNIDESTELPLEELNADENTSDSVMSTEVPPELQ